MVSVTWRIPVLGITARVDDLRNDLVFSWSGHLTVHNLNRRTLGDDCFLHFAGTQRSNERCVPKTSHCRGKYAMAVSKIRDMFEALCSVLYDDARRYDVMLKMVVKVQRKHSSRDRHCSLP